MMLGAKTLLAVLATLSVVNADITQEEADNLELFWSYGRSEAVYPTPEGTGIEEWSDAYTRAKVLVSQMTNEEKANMTYGYSTTDNGCGGMSGGVPRLGFPGLCLHDAGNGVRGADLVNSYPSGIHVGASWNKALAHERGEYMGMEFNAKGVNVMLGPVVGPLGKTARGGRAWEGFSNDPYLTGALAFETIDGSQDHVVACVKHFIGNEQEQMRSPRLGYNKSLSINIDDVTMHELYMWPFQDAIRAGAGSIMMSYNRINNSFATQNSKSMNGLIKSELGFQGFLVSDWGAQHTGIASANAGLDMVMPSGTYWGNNNLTNAVANGTMDQTRLDDMAVRILASYYQYSNENATGKGIPESLLDDHELIEGRVPESRAVLLQGAVEGHVLVKNVENALPFKNPKMISIFGYDAVAAQLGTYNLDWVWMGDFAMDNTLTWPNGTDVNGTEMSAIFRSTEDPHILGPGVALNGTMIVGGGSGANTPSYIDAPLDAFVREAYDAGFYLKYDTVNQNPDVQQSSDACVVFVNELASEGWDRPYLADPYSDELIKNVASQCANTMVVIHNAGVRLVDEFYDHENITAIIYAHLPGQDSGRALTELMFGRQSPSGRLPYTVAKNASDYGALLDPIMPQEDSIYYPQDNATEGVYIDYKHFIKNQIEPRFAFGYGLTYTEFEYSNLQIELESGVNTDAYPPGADVVLQGGVGSLFDILATVTVTVTNTGNFTAAEVAQLYVGIPNGPEKVLRGFEKQALAPGETADFIFQLTRRDLSSWDVVSQQWELQSGDFNIYVGKSVLDIQLEGTLFV